MNATVSTDGIYVIINTCVQHQMPANYKVMHFNSYDLSRTFYFAVQLTKEGWLLTVIMYWNFSCTPNQV